MTFTKRAGASPGVRNILLTVLVSPGTLVITQGLYSSLCLLDYQGTVDLFRGLDGD